MKKAALIVIGFLFVVAIALVLWPRERIKGVDADLKYVRVEIPAEQNAFLLIEKAGAALTLTEDEKKEVSGLINKKVYDSERASEILAENSEALALFWDALQKSHVQVPELKDFAEDLPYLGTWKSLTSLAQLNAGNLFWKGDEKEAFEQALQIVRFGQNVQECDGFLIHYLVGSSIKRAGCRTIREMLAKTTLDANTLRSYQASITALPPAAWGISNVIKAEYHFQVDAIKKMQLGQWPGTTNSAIERVGLSLMTRPFFSVKKTQDLFTQSARNNLKSAPLPFHSLPTNTLPLANASLAQRLMSGNMVGKMFVEMLRPAEEKFFERKCQDTVELAATRLLLAWRRYQIERGTLPESLQQLVPDFIDSIPLDDFDGKPMKYSAELKVVYSVGPDLVDSGGKDKDANGKRLDFVYDVEF